MVTDRTEQKLNTYKQKNGIKYISSRRANKKNKGKKIPYDWSKL